MCVWNADKLQEYVDSAKWSRGLKVNCIQMASCLSAGDALRELDSQGLIRSDPFVLISGDVVSNMDLKKAIEFHKARRKADSNAIGDILFVFRLQIVLNTFFLGNFELGVSLTRRGL